MSEPAASSIEAEAAGLGVVDALLFRRVSPTTWVHLGGLGRGRSWAGIVDVSATDDPLLADLPARPGEVLRFTHLQATRVLGPYYAVGGALVRVSNDVAAVLGNPTTALHSDVSDAALCHLAHELDTSVGDVAPSKRLADELEVLHAVRAVTTSGPDDLAGTLQRVVDIAVDALSCEVGVLRDGAGHVATSRAVPGFDVLDHQVGLALDAMQQVVDDRGQGSWVCIQDTSTHPVLAPLGREHGVRSLLAVSIPAPVGGLLVVAHTSLRPRGFTTLCQRLGRHVADAAAVVAHTAGLRDELLAAGEAHARLARLDPLTGLGNRLAWDEALARTQDEIDAGAAATVITLDVDGLKHVNDTCGHDAGDDLLRRCADVLRDHGRRDDVCVRLGGDEFAVLMPHAGNFAAHRLFTLSDRLGGVTSCEDTVAASLGMATAEPGGSVADAAREADAAMYAHKRMRRARAAAANGTLQPSRRAAPVP